MQLNFEIDTRWCLQHLAQDGLISERDQHLVQTTQRQRQQLTWHPLQWIAQFKLRHQQQHSALQLQDLCQWLADRTALELYKIDPLTADVAALTEVMSQEFALKNHILAVEVQAAQVLVGTVQPFQRDWISNLERSLLPKKVQLVLLDPAQFQRYVQEFYQVSRAVTASQKSGLYLRDLRGQAGMDALLQLGEQHNPDANDQHIVKLVDWILQFAFEQRASDIHIEPQKQQAKIRFRIDGMLHSIYQMPANTASAVVSRLKILARMNVAEKRKPQDGRLKTRTPKGQETELRLSTMPTAFGEKLVLRIFDPEVLLRSYAQLGFEPQMLQDWLALTQHRHGIILVTGPTGSGKTTTLYSTLKQLATDQVNVCTVEDPIEMVEPSFNQMQVNPAIELNFATGIRTLMRQDPDIMMVGEIRDQETANMAVQAALTGHLVLSTLHTNDAPASLVRLHDLGIQPYLSAATLLGVLAQRLVRQLCDQCKQAGATDPAQWQYLIQADAIEMPSQVFHAIGCEACRQTGYRGRLGLYELMPISLALKQLISQNASLDALARLARAEGMRPLRIAAAEKVSAGLSSLEEVLSVVPLH